MKARQKGFGRNDAQVQSEALLIDFITEWCK